LLSIFPTSGNLSGDVCGTLFGGTEFLSLKPSEVWLTVGLSCTVILVFVFLYNKLFAVTFDETPVVDTENHTITPMGGDPIAIPDYYDIQLDGNTVSFSLNNAAIPQIMTGERQTEDGTVTIPAFEMDVSGTGNVGIGTATRKGLYYAIQVGSSVHNIESPDNMEWVPGDGSMMQLMVERPVGSSCGFYRVIVTDKVK